MDHSVLLIIMTTCLTKGATLTLKGHVYTTANIDDKELTEYPLFEVPAKTSRHCAVKCNQDEGCLTFTLRAGMCLGHSSSVTSCTALRDAPGAKSFFRKEGVGQSASEVAEALKCEQTGVKQLTVPSLGLDVEVYCENDWLVFLRRQDGSVDFYRNWQNYTTGFGSACGEFWLGLENIHLITQFQTYEMRVDIGDWEGNEVYADYSNFYLTSDTQFYVLRYDYYAGGTAGDSLYNHVFRPFSTWDADHDSSTNDENCAERYHGAWWYSLCHVSNLCGDYKPNSSAPGWDGISWKSYKAWDYSLKFAQMKIRPAVQIFY